MDTKVNFLATFLRVSIYRFFYAVFFIAENLAIFDKTQFIQKILYCEGKGFQLTERSIHNYTDHCPCPYSGSCEGNNAWVVMEFMNRIVISDIQLFGLRMNKEKLSDIQKSHGLNLIPWTFYPVLTGEE